MANKQLKLISSKETATYKCWFDGSYDPHTHRAGFGCVVMHEGRRVLEIAESIIGDSCNHAEYLALREILYFLRRRGSYNKTICIYGDSQLVIKQMNGKWRILSGAYVALALECRELCRDFTKIQFKWIPRTLNKVADNLSRLA